MPFTCLALVPQLKNLYKMFTIHRKLDREPDCSEVHSSSYNMLVLSLWTASAVDFNGNNLTRSSVCRNEPKLCLQ